MLSRTKEEPKRLNLGCGLNAPSGWINIDASYTARFSKILGGILYRLFCKTTRREPIPWPQNIKILDVRKGLPYPDNSIEAIFSSHMFEHMKYQEANFVIRECYRCLAPNGIIRIIVPDLFQMAKRYVDLMTIEPKSEHSDAFLESFGYAR